MIVYCPFHSVIHTDIYRQDDDGDALLGVYTTKEKAEKEIADYISSVLSSNEENGVHCTTEKIRDTIIIHEWEDETEMWLCCENQFYINEVELDK